MIARLLLVEDEIDLGNITKQYLELVDFTVDWCTTGKDAQRKACSDSYHLIIIDINLPDINGFEVASYIKQHAANMPFLFLSARRAKTDRLTGLKLGADDYVTKPFDIDELVLRIRNIINRNRGMVPGHPCLQIGDFCYYRDTLKLVVGGNKEISLTPQTSRLLDYLLSNSNRLLERKEILEHVWGSNDYFLGRSLDVFMSRLRKYLKGNELISISNVYGVGFVFNVKA
ncbi:response regulator transcription factor [Danxiaibacter flavus]|uniref:Response regulator transcription factor n=1 Tax=Danxiaibacter flavus TaxID=3049108 RepID=A0ABV3Z7Q3_9BACT|nr:response regulator transcription factor [Chitinophagaceae bacterium DXS]